jgi:hypothetical protein
MPSEYDRRQAPDLTLSNGNFGKDWKRLASGMQEDQIVVPLEEERLLDANPVDASLYVCQETCCLRFAMLRSCRLSSSTLASAMTNFPFVNVPTTSGK